MGKAGGSAGSGRLRRAATILTCAVLTALGLGPLTMKSFAGTYNATECAFWNTYSQAGYSESGHHMLVVTRDCGAGGNGLGMTLPQGYWSGFGSEARFQLGAPAGTHFGSVSFMQKGVDADGWYQNVIACGPSGCSDAGPQAGGVWRGIATPSGYYTSWIARLYCLNGGGCYGSTQAGLFVRDVTMTMSDDAAPTVSESGQLLSGEVQRGTGVVDVSARDTGAGLSQIYVAVNDQIVGAQNLACAGPGMQPCSLATSQPVHFNLDTQSTPFHDGENTVQACAADYGAPPNVTCTARHVVNVDNSCTPSSVPGGSHLSAVFSQSYRDTIHVKAGQGAKLIGKLTDDSGDPVARATLCTSEAVTGQPMASVGTVSTNANGRYKYAVSPGPNRTLRVGYRYNRNQVERRAHFKSRLRPRLKLSPKHKTENGKRLRLYGSIPGPRNDGRIVILQASAIHSKQWLTFRKARTDRLGYFTARYRFTETRTTTRYRFRALVPPQNGYPYDGGTGRAKKIKVIGR